MKTFKTLPILMYLAGACGTQGSFDNGASGESPRTPSAKRPRTATGNMASSEVGDEDATAASAESQSTDLGSGLVKKGQGTASASVPSSTTSETKSQEGPAKAPEAPSAPTAFLTDVESSVGAAMAGSPGLAQLSPAQSAKLGASLTALAQGAALGQGVAANAAAIQALLDLLGNLGNLGALPGAAALNAAALADVAAAAQDLAAAAAALDLAGVQAAIADIIQAIMDLIG